MAKAMKQGDVLEMAHAYFPSHRRSRESALVLDSWMEGRQYDYTDSADLDADHRGYGRPFQPRLADTNDEYENLRGLSPNNFAGLIVTTLAQTAYIEGIRRPGVLDTMPVWETFQRNRWQMRQTQINRGAIGQGVAYGVVLPGEDPLTGSKMSKMLGKSAVRMSAFYDDDDDEWATIAVEAQERYEVQESAGPRPVFVGWNVQIYDAYVVHRLRCKGHGTELDDWTYVDFVKHDLPVPPVARLANRLDLEGRAHGEIEPVLPLLRRVDQDLFDRLIVQRFGAWQVRYIAGMAKPKTGSDAAAEKLRLRVEDILISTNEKTKFGVLPGGDLKPQIEATDNDLRLLSAITQTPPHHLLGLSSNLQAEALAAAEAGLQRKSFDFRTNASEFHEQMARLVSMSDGDLVTAAAWDLQVRWRDTESRSMTQAADALGKLAVQLKVPIEMLWERIPGWTDTDVQRAKELAENGTLDELLGLLADTTEQPATTQTGDTGGSQSE